MTRTGSLTLLRGAEGVTPDRRGSHGRGHGMESSGMPRRVTGSAVVAISAAVDEEHAEAARRVIGTPDALLTLVLGGDHLTAGLQAIRAALRQRRSEAALRVRRGEAARVRISAPTCRPRRSRRTDRRRHRDVRGRSRRSAAWSRRRHGAERRRPNGSSRRCERGHLTSRERPGAGGTRLRRKSGRDALQLVSRSARPAR